MRSARWRPPATVERSVELGRPRVSTTRRTSASAVSAEARGRRRGWAASTAARSSLEAAAPAQAKQYAAGPTGATSLSFALDLDPGPYGWGLGFRVGLPIAPNGVIHGAKVRDEFQLEVGGDYLHYEASTGWPNDYHYSWNGIVGVAGLQWNFWLVPQLALYPKIDLGFSSGWYTGIDLFEARRAGAPSLGLKDAYRILRATDAGIRLVPGLPARSLASALPGTCSTRRETCHTRRSRC